MGRRPRRRFEGSQGPTGPVLLGIETGGEHLGLALWRLPEEPGRPPSAWRLLEDATSFRGRRHASSLLPMLDEMLDRQGLAPDDVDLVAVGRGPGGFTGVRVGMATGLGLGLGQGAPVWAVDSLAVLASNSAGDARLALPLLDARKGEVYGALYRVPAKGPPVRLMEPLVAPHEAALERAREAAAGEPIAVFGSGALAFDCADAVPPAWHLASAATTAYLAGLEWEAAGRSAAAAPPVDPAYVRKSDAELALGR
ncbi:MAG: tRNA (adenosine(37)-N6)-threonylcarbamoyltransferase complex dimerization subunit type 1 TsaB [Myxococcota bacterium]